VEPQVDKPNSAADNILKIIRRSKKMNILSQVQAMATGDNRSLTLLLVVGGIAALLGIVSIVLKIINKKK
jgi:hypothetical protein